MKKKETVVDSNIKEENIESSTSEKVKIKKVKKEKVKREINKKLLAIIIAGIILIIAVLLFLFKTDVDTITKVKKVASAKYYSVECLNNNCDYIVAAKGNKLGKSKITVFDANGDKVASFKDKFYSNKSYGLSVSEVSKNYILFKKVDKVQNEVQGYIISTTKGKNKYDTSNSLKKINDNLISERDSKDSRYLVLNKKGKILYDGVTSINVYAKGKIIALNVKGNDVLINENGENVLGGYYVSKEVNSSKGDTLYLVLSDSKSNAYYYYNVESNKIIGDGFNGYVSSDKEGELIITKRVNNSNVRYTLNSSGKQTKISDETVNERVSFIKEKIGSDYALYVSSVVDAEQRYVFVNKIADSSFGVYDVDSGKYTKLYNYSSDDKATTIYNLESNDKGIYMQATCNKGYCDKTRLFIYDLGSNKELFRSEDESMIPQKYAEYTNGYKVIRYSSSSTNEKYQGKYVLYNKKGKELVVSSNIIVPVGEENLFGEISSSKALILYSTKENKVLNSDSYLGSKINVSGTYVYKFSDSENTYLFSDKGKKITSIKISDAKLIYSDETIVYILNNKINIIDPTTGRVRKYRLKSNERINDISGDVIAPYRNSLYISNPNKDYVKVINVKGRTVKKIKKAEIKSVVKNDKTNNVIMIVRNIKNNNNYYGLYIAK